MGKGNDSPKIPKIPDSGKLYKRGVNDYFKYLPRFLQGEVDSRNQYDPTRIEEQQHLQDQYGPKQYQQMLDAIRALDPSGYNLREQTAGNISSYMGKLGGDLAQGTKLTPEQEKEYEQEIRRSQAARGNTYGQAPVNAEALTKGRAGLALYQQRLNNYNQGLGTSLGFQNSATPEQWASAIPPVSPDRSMAYVNPNAGFQGQQFGLQNFQNALGAAGLGQQSGSNPWMSALGSIASIAGPILGAAFSDARLKNIHEKIGNANGVNLYKFSYKDQPAKPMIGAIAQEVQQTRPDAVGWHPSGFMQVDYGKLGLPTPQPTGDTQPAMLKPGEVVLNEGQQAKVGLGRIHAAVGNRHGTPMGGGVRGYSEGGYTDIGERFDPETWADPGPLPSPTPNPYGNNDPNVNINHYPSGWGGNTPPMDIPLTPPNDFNFRNIFGNGPGSGVPTQRGIGAIASLISNGLIPGTGAIAGPLARWITKTIQSRLDHPHAQGPSGQHPSGSGPTPNQAGPNNNFGGGGFDPFGGLPPGFDEGNRFGHGAPTFTGPGYVGPRWNGGSIFSSSGGPGILMTPGGQSAISGSPGGNLGAAGAKMFLHGTGMQNWAQGQGFNSVGDWLRRTGFSLTTRQGGGGQGIGGGQKPMTQNN